MPYAHHIIETDRLALVSGSGPGTCDTWLAELQAISVDPGLGADLAVLFDLTDLDYVPSGTDSERIAGAFRRLLGRHPIALLARAGAQYGGARQVSIFSEIAEVTVQAFQDYDEAVAWLARVRGVQSIQGQEPA